MFVTDRLRKIWFYLFNRNPQGVEARFRMRGLYAMKDPWQLDSAREQARFAWTKRLVTALPTRPARLLEIGCGEGHQSQWLAQTCDALQGVDISELAIARARRRLPAARFSTTGWQTADDQARLLAGGERFDLVTACEMLYYLADVPAALAALERLGRTVLVTSFAGRAEHVMPHVRARVGAGLGEDSFSLPDGTTWLAAWWSPGPPPLSTTPQKS